MKIVRARFLGINLYILHPQNAFLMAVHLPVDAVTVFHPFSCLCHLKPKKANISIVVLRRIQVACGPLVAVKTTTKNWLEIQYT